MDTATNESNIVICPACLTANRVPSSRLGERPSCGKCGRPLFQARPLAVDAAGLDRLLLKGTIPILVDFWAEWCGPCRMMAPQFEAAAAALEPQVRLVKVDIDAAPAIAARYGIRSVPTLALFAGGREVARRAGLTDRAALVAWVQGELGRR
ncbi:MAG TPA: thioredoxin TrxC [Sphingomonas sp.]